MKTTVISGLIMFVALAFSCNVTEKETEPVNSGSGRLNDTLDVMPATAVDIETAKESIKRYVRIAGQLYTKADASTDSVVRAFTIPASDLWGVLGESTKEITTKYTHCRVYLGLDSIPITGDSGYYLKNKLFMVPVNAKLDVNMFYLLPSNKGKKTCQQFVYDLITPCPKTCDPESPLYVR